MFESNMVDSLICYTVLSGMILLTIGSVCVWLCREPIFNIRIIQWTFVGCLVVPLVQVSGLVSSVSIPVLSKARKMAPAAMPMSHSEPLKSISQKPDEFADHPEMLSSAAMPDPTSPLASDTSSVAHQPSSFHDSKQNQTASLSATSFSAWGRWVSWSWIVCAAMFTSWWSISLLLRQRIVARSQVAPEHVRELFDSISTCSSSHVRLLISDDLNSPVMWGIFRPTIMIPEAHLDDPQALRWGLAHEWCHVVHWDFHARLLSMATCLICFFQPCFWWLNRELSHHQDVLADAFAAKHGHADEYASFLVNMSQRKGKTLALGLGIAEGRSPIFRRVQSLLGSPAPLPKLSRLATIALSTCSILTISCLGAVHLGTSPEQESIMEEAVPAAASLEQAPVRKPNEKPTVHTGVVVDAQTGLPISGATVSVRRELSRDPKTQKWILLDETKHTTNLLGVYSFSLTAKQVAQPSLYLEVKTEHPDYQLKPWSGYSYKMLRTNAEKGDLPWFARIRLHPGEPLFGKVVDERGKPLSGTRVSYYTKAGNPKSKIAESNSRVSHGDTTTDSAGNFQIVVPTPGDGVLAIHPQHHASQAYRIGSKRGNFGVCKMGTGTRVAGLVLDAQGAPVSGAGVTLTPVVEPKQADGFLNISGVASFASGGTESDAAGTFQMKPLAPGKYRLRVTNAATDPTKTSQPWFVARSRPPLQHVFSSQAIEITEGPMEPIVCQAIPHATISGQFLSSDGEPTDGHATRLAGQFKGKFFSATSTRPDRLGRFEIRAPIGVSHAEIMLSTNEHSSLRWQLPTSKGLSRGSRIKLKTLDHDIGGLKIIRYVAPIVVVSVVDENGKPARNYKLACRYTKPDKHANIVFSTGDLNFEKQSDGRWRSSQMLPDEEVTISILSVASERTSDSDVIKPVSLATPKTMTLKEGETREIRFVLKPN